MTDAPAPPPDPARPTDEAVSVTLTYTGEQAEILRTLALLEGRSPEEVALARITRGIPLTFSTSFGEDPRVLSALEAAMFDGPVDLAERSGEGLFGEAGNR